MITMSTVMFSPSGTRAAGFCQRSKRPVPRGGRWKVPGVDVEPGVPAQLGHVPAVRVTYSCPCPGSSHSERRQSCCLGEHTKCSVSIAVSTRETSVVAIRDKWCENKTGSPPRDMKTFLLLFSPWCFISLLIFLPLFSQK